ncbi:hypothetical protein FRC01_012294, partial [Tulasnella sp. 417]
QVTDGDDAPVIGWLPGPLNLVYAFVAALRRYSLSKRSQPSHSDITPTNAIPQPRDCAVVMKSKALPTTPLAREASADAFAFRPI